jgi:hypothetical protein
VEAVERKPRLFEMVELVHIEGTNVGFPSGMLDVTHDAVVGDLAVHTAFFGNPVCHLFVAAEATSGGHTLSWLVT